MYRSKKIIFAVHCLLNQNARAKTVAKCPGAVKEFLDFCVKNNYGIVPIDCPQLMFEPIDRKPETKEFYDNKKSRKISEAVSRKVVEQIKLYRKNNYKIGGIYGVEGSPTCGAVKTHIKNKEGKIISVEGSGIFFEELKKALKKNHLSVKIYDWDIQAKRLLSKKL
jgi:predicted secreted protein